MTAIIWDKIEDRTYETGIDRGVLYFPDGGAVPWNGLTSVAERNTNTVDSVYFDGIKFNDLVTVGDFSATLKAYTYPEEFLEYQGLDEDQTGVYIADQQPKLFNLSYRTKIGNLIDGSDAGYKIHLLWNLTAIPSTRTYETLSLDSDPIEFEWSITAVPEDVDLYRPTAHVILDSRKMDPLLLSDIESFLYGDEEREPTLPSLKGFTSFIRKWDRIIITDNGDGTWTATTQLDGVIEFLDEDLFQINDANAVYLDSETYEISSTEKNEEDIY